MPTPTPLDVPNRPKTSNNTNGPALVYSTFTGDQRARKQSTATKRSRRPVDPIQVASLAWTHHEYSELSNTSLAGMVAELMLRHYPDMTGEGTRENYEAAYWAARKDLDMTNPQTKGREDALKRGRKVAEEALEWARYVLSADPNEVVGVGSFYFGSYPLYADDFTGDCGLALEAADGIDLSPTTRDACIDELKERVDDELTRDYLNLLDA